MKGETVYYKSVGNCVYRPNGSLLCTACASSYGGTSEDVARSGASEAAKIAIALNQEIDRQEVFEAQQDAQSALGVQ